MRSLFPGVCTNLGFMKHPIDLAPLQAKPLSQPCASACWNSCGRCLDPPFGPCLTNSTLVPLLFLSCFLGWAWHWKLHVLANLASPHAPLLFLSLFLYWAIPLGSSSSTSALMSSRTAPLSRKRWPYLPVQSTERCSYNSNVKSSSWAVWGRSGPLLHLSPVSLMVFNSVELHPMSTVS